MNNIDEMWPICHDCPYWEVCDYPYICEATEQKMKIKKQKMERSNLPECGKTVFECNMCLFHKGCKQRKEV
jgi:hypothetical protein